MQRPPPTLETVRSSTDVSRALTQLLVYYDEQAEITNSNAKKPAYDDMSMAQ